MVDKLYTLKEAADILKIKENTLRMYCRQQKISFSIVGRFYRISQEQLDEYYRVNTIPMRNTTQREE